MKTIEIIVDGQKVQVYKENPVILINFKYGTEEDLYCTLLGHVTTGIVDLKTVEEKVFKK